MKITFYDSKSYDIKFFNNSNLIYDNFFEFNFITHPISKDNLKESKNSEVVCCFVNDNLGESIIRELKNIGCKMIALRCAGFDNVNLSIARECKIPVVRVPVYSPVSVAEHSIGLMLAVNRNIIQASKMISNRNFNIDGLEGYTIKGRTVGIIGTGQIGLACIKLLKGFDVKIIAYDLYPKIQSSEELNFTYENLDVVFSESDFLLLWVPGVPENKYLINKNSINKMKKNVVIINCSRGSLINTKDLLDALNTENIRGAGLDVYESEAGIFFNDFSNRELKDELLKELISHKRVVLTAHQSFLTYEALECISSTTLNNIYEYFKNKNIINSL